MPKSRHDGGNLRRDSQGEGAPVRLIMGYVYDSALRYEASTMPFLSVVEHVDTQAAPK